MPLTKQSAVAAVTGLTAMVLHYYNPNFDTYDIQKAPQSYVQKYYSHRGYEHSGKYYFATAIVSSACLAGLVINALSGNIYQKNQPQHRRSRRRTH